MACGHNHRHCGASRNPGGVVIITVIAAQAGIQDVWPYAPSSRLPQPSLRRKPESMACGHMHRHSGLRRNPGGVVIPTVIAAQAGIYGVWSHSPSLRRKPASRACGHMHRHCGASRHPGVRSYSPSFQFFRHSGESRNLRAAMDSGFRRNDGPIPKPPEKKHYPCPTTPPFCPPPRQSSPPPRPRTL